MYVYYNCGVNHLKEEGIPMCKMGKKYINKLFDILEEQFTNVIRNNIINQYNSLAEKQVKATTKSEFFTNLYL